jgi:protein TonB
VNEAVDRLIVERERMDAGFSGGFLASLVGHLVFIGFIFAAPFLFPAEPPLRVADGFAVPLPRGGGGAPPPPPQAIPPATPEAPPAAPEPPKVLKPPKDEPVKKGLPELDAKKTRKKAPEPEPARTRGDSRAASAGTKPAAASTTPGLEFGPPGIGVPEGTDTSGDWYLAGVQQKIWMIWNQQIRTGFTQPVGVVFTILADGSVTDVKLVQSSGASLLDLAAQRAIYSAAPFGPLPKDYGTNRKTIQALFKPTS